MVVAIGRVQLSVRVIDVADAAHKPLSPTGKIDRVERAFMRNRREGQLESERARWSNRSWFGG